MISWELISWELISWENTNRTESMPPIICPRVLVRWQSNDPEFKSRFQFLFVHSTLICLQYVVHNITLRKLYYAHLSSYEFSSFTLVTMTIYNKINTITQSREVLYYCKKHLYDYRSIKMCFHVVYWSFVSALFGKLGS